MLLKNSRFYLFFKSIRFRLTALFACIFGTTLICFNIILYQVFTHNHMREFDAALYNYTVDVSNGIQVNFFGDLKLQPSLPFDEKKAFPFTLGRAFFQITDVNGNILAKSENLRDYVLPINAPEITKLLGEEVILQSIDAKEMPTTRDLVAHNYRLIKYLVKLPTSMHTVLLVAVPMTLFEKESKGMLAFLWFFLPIVLGLATLGGWFFAGSALKPIKLINAKARGIRATNLSERLPVPAVDDEIKHLSVTLNQLLARIEHAFESQERFIADVSHEMKTPLAIMRGELDLIKEKKCSVELREYLESTEQEIKHLSELVENLLLLARVDAGVSCLAQGAVRFDEMVLDTVARVEQLAQRQKKKISINLVEKEGVTSSTNFQLRGDAGLLQCLTKNLVENAIKYSDLGENVDVEVVDQQNDIVLTVRDYGNGIPAEEKSKIFQRFYRGESTRNRVRGSGLGLHLAERIADIHGGRISVVSKVGSGTVFRVELPKAIAGSA